MMRIYFIFSCVFLNLSSAAFAVDCEFEFKGAIDKNFIRTISEVMCAEPVLELASIGGEEEVSFMAAAIIEKKMFTIVVNEFCLSACAEVILPAASNIEFNGALIGFHGNPIMRRDLMRVYKPRGYEYCKNHSADEMERLYKRKGLNPQFWKDQLAYLKLVKIGYLEGAKKTCPIPKYEFENEMYLPNSNELTKNLGLKFSGTVCVDIKECRAWLRKDKKRDDYVFSQL